MVRQHDAVTTQCGRTLCVVVARAPQVVSEEMATSPAQASAATRLVLFSDDLLVTLEVVAAPLGAKVVRLLDGSVIVTLNRSGNAADQAARAARCAT